MRRQTACLQKCGTFRTWSFVVENKFRSWTSPIAAAFIALKRSPARDNSDADRPSPDPPEMIYKAKNGRAFTASEKKRALFTANNHFTRLQDCLYRKDVTHQYKTQCRDAHLLVHHDIQTWSVTLDHVGGVQRHEVCRRWRLSSTISRSAGCIDL